MTLCVGNCQRFHMEIIHGFDRIGSLDEFQRAKIKRCIVRYQTTVLWVPFWCLWTSSSCLNHASLGGYSTYAVPSFLVIPSPLTTEASDRRLFSWFSSVSYFMHAELLMMVDAAFRVSAYP
jgi:hypothetical protein